MRNSTSTSSIKINTRTIGQGNPCYIVAEAGVNHNGKLSLAKKLVDKAVDVGADAVKFQIYRTHDLVTKKSPLAAYQKNKNTPKSQYHLLKKFELSFNDFRVIKDYCQKKSISFLATPFDEQSAQFLFSLKPSIIKIGSGDLDNEPLIGLCARYDKPIFLSTGMSSINDIRLTLQAVKREGNSQIVLLHCTSSYPTPYEDVNLKAMDTLQQVFHVPVGYSDHTLGIDVAVAAVARGACVIEKHFKLNCHLSGPDHSVSLQPKEFKELVSRVRRVENALGKGEKSISQSEKRIRQVVRRSLVAKIEMRPGERFTRESLAIMRPGTGLSPRLYNKVLNKKCACFLLAGKLLRTGDIIW